MYTLNQCSENGVPQGIYTAAADSHFLRSAYTISRKREGVPHTQLTMPSAKREFFFIHK
jgi:hypothetical protein